MIAYYEINFLNSELYRLHHVSCADARRCILVLHTNSICSNHLCPRVETQPGCGSKLPGYTPKNNLADNPAPSWLRIALEPGIFSKCQVKEDAMLGISILEC